MSTDKRQSVINEWFPVAAAADIEPGSAVPFELLDDRYLLLCDADGSVSVVPDTCPHRGAKLSLGSFDGHQLVCPYHGWRFGADGHCVVQPAHPDRKPPASANLATFANRRAYDLWWVCLGDEPRELPRYPAFERFPGQSTLCDARTVAAAGPRLVENFLDLAHLPFVHQGSLGVNSRAAVVDHEIAVSEDEIEATDCHFWQPQPGPADGLVGDNEAADDTGDSADSTAAHGMWVTYSFAVSHPYAARLQKVPRLGVESEADPKVLPDESASFDILLAVSPESELRCRVWMLTTAHGPEADLDAFNKFGAFIFDQDVPVVESQRPALLPLDPKAELHQRADRMSLAYRRWLLDRNIQYGTERN